MTLRNATTITPTETRVRPTQPVEQGRLLLGRYEIRETFNRGQNGTVYKAWDNQESRFVGIREVKNDNSPQAKHARREYQIGQRLDHPGISKYHELQAADGNIYVVREWGEGQTLRELGAVGPEQRKEVMQQVLDIVEYVHSQGTVLRDLKSSNLSFSNGEVKLFEIGGSILAGEREERDQLSTLGVAGTTISTAPEVWMGATVLISDIWSCGSVLAELCLGHELEYDTERYKLKFEQIEDEKDRKIVEKAMKNEPSERYQTAKQMKEALEENQTEALTVRQTHEVTTQRRRWFEIRLPEKAIGEIGYTALFTGISTFIIKEWIMAKIPEINNVPVWANIIKNVLNPFLLASIAGIGVTVYKLVKYFKKRNRERIAQVQQEQLPTHSPVGPILPAATTHSQGSSQQTETTERFNRRTAELLLRLARARSDEEFDREIPEIVQHLQSEREDIDLSSALHTALQLLNTSMTQQDIDEIVERIRFYDIRDEIRDKLISGIRMIPEVYNRETANLLEELSAQGLSETEVSTKIDSLISHLGERSESRPVLVNLFQLLAEFPQDPDVPIVINAETRLNPITRSKLKSAINLLGERDNEGQIDFTIFGEGQ